MIQSLDLNGSMFWIHSSTFVFSVIVFSHATTVPCIRIFRICTYMYIYYFLYVYSVYLSQFSSKVIFIDSPMSHTWDWLWDTNARADVGGKRSEETFGLWRHNRTVEVWMQRGNETTRQLTPAPYIHRSQNPHDLTRCSIPYCCCRRMCRIWNASRRKCV